MQLICFQRLTMLFLKSILYDMFAVIFEYFLNAIFALKNKIPKVGYSLNVYTFLEIYKCLCSNIITRNSINETNLSKCLYPHRFPRKILYSNYFLLRYYVLFFFLFVFVFKHTSFLCYLICLH